MTQVERAPEEYVLKSIRDAYLTREVHRTRECMEGMAREGLFEVDVEKVFMDAQATGSGKTGEVGPENPDHTGYVIYGKSSTGAQVCCRFASKHHPKTNDFIHWVLTSFEQVGVAK
jgi:hypothetical protein